ncbi:anti-sigma factor [Streptomyces sp. 549]|uniref:anti-sigma factor n=1 Tax=Streptomyces sp. 549 TaxID=3049076 RepID=UPI0024C252EA|nr:anti-sigma factor [Streptomyces sp. 549]MDK1475423.1 anti-sigma factor [Streptomyces sp. 549]
MRHIEPAELSELALGGESAQGPTAEHLHACAHCRTELAVLRRVVRAARTAAPEADRPTPPSPRVWQGIAAALSHDADGSPDTTDADPDATAADTPGGPAMPGGPSARSSAGPSARPAAAGPVAGQPRRSRRPALLAAACLAAGAVLGGTATHLLGGGDPAPAMQAGPDVTLSPLPADLDAVGTVRLERLSDPSAREVRIRVEGLPRTSGFFEVWLMDADGKKLISIGVLHGDGTASLPLPPGVDIGEYSQVDVSDQPYNGSPEHSGRSLVRGALAG